jgi:4-hydroxybenzoate polyprenyltransferase
MFTRSAWLHLRIPFSYFLLPVFLFSLSISPNFTEASIFWVFFLIHFFLYPASNGFNSYFDKDEKSIGGLKNPPPVNKGLYYLSLLFDVVAVVMGFVKIGLLFAVMLFIYGLVSKAYSHPSIRLKKYAIAGWIITGLFQGLFTFCMCYIGLNKFSLGHLCKDSVLIPGMLTTIMLWANYPMTQVYQHEEDAKRGDRTFSLMLGIKGTFIFVGGVFAVVTLAFVWYFNKYVDVKYAIAFLTALFPVVVYFLYWFLKVIKDESQADHKHTMLLNFISATCLNAFFLYLFLDVSQALQTL